jgi:Fe-S cluster assembly protein SufD
VHALGDREDLMNSLTNQFNANKNTGNQPSLVLNSLRSSGYEAFQRLGFPSRADEDWKFTSLRDLTDFNFSVDGTGEADGCAALATHLDVNDINVVFINGVLSLEKSNLSQLPAGVKIIPLNTAFNEHAEILESLICPRGIGPLDGLSALNQAFLKEGVLILVDKNSCIARPIHIFYGDGDEMLASAAFPRILVDMGESSELTILESTVGTKSRCFINSVENIHLRKNSRLRHYKIQASSHNAIHIDQTLTIQEKDSSYESFCLGLGGKLARTSLQVKLAGTGAEAVLNGVYLTRESQQIDQHLVIDHEVGNSRSAQFYKGILDDQSKAVFSGKVLVRKGAQKTEARQLNRNLMLSNEAEIDTIPQLEIDADDIKCSHGATIGQLRQDELFYLQTRGINKEDAKLLLGRAFAEEAVLKISDADIQRRVMKSIANVLPKVK